MSYSIFKVGKHKKASLSLSINAIVVLVLAIAMLGLGLSFTKGMFKKFGEKLTVPPPDIPATAGEPIVLPTDEIVVKHGKEAIFQVNYYNDYGDGLIMPYLDCSGGGPVCDTVGCFDHINSDPVEGTGSLYVVAAPQNIDGGESKPFKFIILEGATEVSTLVPDLAGKQAICEVKFEHALTENTDTRQITLKVT